MVRLVDRIGHRYGKVVVLSREPNRGTSARWLCKCDCGKEFVTYGQDLAAEKVKSCGCVRTEKAKTAGRKNRTHGLSHSRVYSTWARMIQRCTNDADERFVNYGGRGICVCERWMVFENFLSDMGFPEDGMSIDRIDNEGNYTPENCRWATSKTQAANRRSTVRLTHNGLTLTMTEWAKVLDIAVCTMAERISRKLPPERLFAPNMKKHL